MTSSSPLDMWHTNACTQRNAGLLKKRLQFEQIHFMQYKIKQDLALSTAHDDKMVWA